VLTHLCAAALCLNTWRGSVMAPSLARIFSGVLGSTWHLDKSDDPDQGFLPIFRARSL
jgi:hypothetical protein